MKAILIFLTISALLTSCKKVQKEQKEQKDTSIYGTYVGKTHLYGVGTPKSYDTVVEQTFVISPRENGMVWIQDKGLFSSSTGFISQLSNDNVYYSGCNNSNVYQILPPSQQLKVSTRFNAGMGGEIYTEFTGNKIDK